MTARALLLSILLALPDLAAAQDAERPVLRELQLNGKKITRAPLGAVITAVGSGFPSDDADGRHPPGLKVTLGGSDVMLLNAQPDAVTVLIPQFGMATGKTTFRVAVADRGMAELELEVVGPQFRPHPGSPLRPRVPDDVADAVLAAFRITRFELVRDGTGARLEAEGTVPDAIPDGFQVDLSLNLDERRELEAQKVLVRGHAWRATFGPYQGELPAGSYSVNLLFELGKQPRVLARRFRDRLEPGVQPIFDLVLRRDFLEVGSAEEAAEQRTRLRNQLLALDAALEGLVRGLDAAAGAAPFNPAPYERWVKHAFFPLLASTRSLHQAFRARSAWALEPRADAWSDRALERVDELLRRRSRDLYAAANLALPDLLATPAELPSTEVLRADLEAARLGALRAAGLERP